MKMPMMPNPIISKFRALSQLQNPPLRLNFACQHLQQLNRADCPRNQDRDDGDGEVVVDFADWVEECPAVGEAHGDAVCGVNGYHAAGEQERKIRM